MSPFESLIANPRAQIPSECSFSSLAKAPFLICSISSRISSSVLEFEPRTSISATISLSACSRCRQASAAFPFAVVVSGNVSPILDTARSRWLPTTWSMKSILSPSRTARSTVSPVSSEIFFMTGRSRSFMSDAVACARLRISGPSLIPPYPFSVEMNPSNASAATTRCTVDRGSATLFAIWPRLRPSVSRPRRRRMSAAREMT